MKALCNVTRVRVIPNFMIDCFLVVIVFLRSWLCDPCSYLGYLFGG